MVERLVANEKVASSTLVTRSSLRLEPSAERGLERVRRSLAEADRPKTAKLRLAGQPSNVLRLSPEVPIASDTAIRRIDLQSATAA